MQWLAPAPPLGATPSIGAAVRAQLARARREAPLGAVLVMVLVTHVAVAPHLAVARAAPDLPLVAVVAVAAGRGPRAGAAFGFAAGLGADLFLATPLGTSALAFTLVGHVVGRRGGARPSGAAAALCSPASTCFACRTGRRHRRTAARRAAVRRAVVLTAAGVGGGHVAAAAVATAFGGVPFPAAAGLIRIAASSALSAPIGPLMLAALRRTRS
jgi:rod shape-determining protein MreD